MLNIQKFFKRRKTLKNKIHKYISKKQDICCEEDIDRNFVIKQIIEKYKNICKILDEPDEYLNYIDNDLVKFIGYKVDLKKNKDNEGIKLCDEMHKRMYENNMVNEEKVEKILHDVPLYFLLSFLGYASYKEKGFSSHKENLSISV
jgi:hypothetical protein|uniref:Uncharacterized protein n=1 Tax=viral metagenome TaxID=1070528 RepID=A0A6C0HTK2_9ZZZZ